MSDLEAVRQAIEERDDALQQVELLAREMVYRGNSVQHWHNKAKAYGTAISEAWDALRGAGIHPDGNTSLANAIRKLAAQETS